MVSVVDGALPRPKGAAVEVKDVHAAAGKLPTQLSLKGMAHVVVNHNTERAVSPR